MTLYLLTLQFLQVHHLLYQTIQQLLQDENIAGAGSTDNGTQKGVAGFNSAHFNVTANGWVSSDIYGGGSTLGIVPSGGASTTFLRGDGTWVTPTNTTYSMMTAIYIRFR